MKKLYFNYVAMGEAVMEWVVNAYVNAVQTINYVGKYNEVSKEAWKTIETIDMKIEQEKVYDFLPHVALDKSLFLDELRGFADKYKNEPNPVPADEYVTRKVWEKLPMTKEREEELENENAFVYAQFVQDMCDEKLLMMCASVEDTVKATLDERLEGLSEDERSILTHRFGLDGKPCMSIKEISSLFEQYTMFDVMRMMRDSLLKLF